MTESHPGCKDYQLSDPGCNCYVTAGETVFTVKNEHWLKKEFSIQHNQMTAFRSMKLTLGLHYEYQNSRKKIMLVERE